MARTFDLFMRESRERRQRLDAGIAAFERQAVEDRQQAQARWEAWEEERRKFRKQMAELSDSMGTLVEDMVRPNAANIAAKIFAGDPVVMIAQRIRRQHPKLAGENAEVDLLVVGRKHVMVVEAKRRMSSEKVTEFVNRVKELKEFFPEYAGCAWVPVVAGVALKPSVVVFLNRQKVYGVALGDETMELVNYGQF
jgi:hypothetical protein